MSSVTVTSREVKEMIIEALQLDGLTPEQMGDESPLFGGSLGLDSIDALELVVALETRYGIKVDSEEIGHEAFASVTALTQFIAERIGDDRPRYPDREVKP